MVSVDTLAACTYVYINESHFKGDWKLRRFIKSINCYIKRFKNFRLMYIPKLNLLRIEFSMSRLFYGTNAVIFDLKYFNTLARIVDKKISVEFPALEIDSLSKWMCNRLDVCVHYYSYNEMEKQSYIDVIKKHVLPRSISYAYPTGKQSTTRSFNFTIYDKFKEIVYRKENKFHTVSREDLSILHSTKDIIRFEIQLKRAALNYRFKQSRQLEELLTQNVLESIITEFLKKSHLNIPILSQQELKSDIKQRFSKTKSRNLLKYIKTANSEGIFIKKKNYSSTLHKAGLNEFYLVEQLHKIDFTDFSGKPFSHRKAFIFVMILRMLYENGQKS